MNISLNWLKDYIEIDNYSVSDIKESLTALGHEVEAVHYPDNFTGVVAAKVLSCEAIPGSKNHKCVVGTGAQKYSVVCGAPNVRAGILVPFITPGGKLPDGKEISRAVISGIESEGMICSEAELRIGGDSSGIWILDEAEFNWELGRDFHTYFPADTVFELEITLNHPDCQGHIGIARELAAFLNLQLKKPQFDLIESSIPASSAIAVEIIDSVKCPRYAGRVVKGVKIAPSPRWMQKRLMAVGLRPISNVVDVTNYVMMEYGHPLHAFDLRFIAGNKIVVKTAVAGEKFVTLDEKEHKLTSDDLLICDGERGVALAGVMGGLNSEIKSDTTDILLECAYFEPVGIRKTAKRLGIATDSSHRFERGVDPNGVPEVIDRAVELVNQTAGGVTLSGVVDNYARKIYPVEIELRPSRVDFIIGKEFTKERIIECLIRLQLEVKSEGDNLKITVPTFRPDLKKEIDLIEEIARIDGYYDLPAATHSLAALEAPPLEAEDFDAVVRQALVSAGMQEVLTHSMRQAQKTGILPAEALKIRNPLSADFAQMRSDLLAPLLETAAYNLNHGAEAVHIFEIGKIFRWKDGQVDERRQIAGVFSGFAEEINWGSKQSEVDIFYIKGVIEDFLKNISLDNYQFSLYLNDSSFKNAVSVKTDNEEIGVLGSFAQRITSGYEIDKPVFFFYFDYSLLFKYRKKVRHFQEYSRFPVVKRDLSVIFSETVTAEEMAAAIKETGGDMLKSVDFFDLYRGKQLEAGKKSVSISLRFQAGDRTLTDAETDAAMAKIITGLQKSGGILRQF